MEGRGFLKKMASGWTLAETGRILASGRHPQLRELHTKDRRWKATAFCRSQPSFFGAWGDGGDKYGENNSGRETGSDDCLGFRIRSLELTW